ncbi:thiol reductant ABC exporter subunit CydD [Acidiferrimicrobium sp. IK]|uniref:thiol reductant ABC exporter subunit CydD n=1 Tax=Acidiferrimicrobium sp. IK TaxID=2871700 RepID=UPI0021CB78D6|nr:thiol reductant ABC exporter subunit CydD [Acidiferrimicrobium sp. IK]MCU4182868.1 thiol reductant ABC exporter subunit CydD [Acidiferrimicrobium sp. IK]
MTEPGGSAASNRAPIDPRLLRAVPSLRASLAGLAAAAALGAAAIVAQAICLAQIVTGVFIHHHLVGQEAAWLAGLAAAMGVKALSAGATELVAQHLSAKLRAALRAKLLDGVVRLGARWLGGTDRGRVVSIAGTGIEGLDGYATRALPALIAAGVVPPVALAAIGAYDWPSLLILCVTLPLVPVFLALIGMTTKRHMDRQWRTLAKLSGQFLDLVEGLTTLKVYGRSRAQIRAVEDGADRYRRETLSTLRVAFLSGLVLDLLATLSVALVAVAVGLRLDHGSLSLQSALVVLLLAPEVFSPLRAVGAQHHATEDARVVISSALTIIEDAQRGVPADRPTPDPRPARHPEASAGGQALEVPGGAVRFERVSYSYPGRVVPVLDHIDLQLGAPGLTVLSGPSGAGKSTLLALLLGQIAPSAGTISTAGGPLRPTPSWYASLAWVPQRPRPTQDTVADEVRLGDPDLTATDLADILAECAAPGPATVLGEDGTAISAGQRRRVVLARALARCRRVARSGALPLVLLDEPSEDLDPVTRDVVHAIVDGMARIASVIVATHDPLLLAAATRVVHVGGGRAELDERPQAPATCRVRRPAPAAEAMVHTSFHRHDTRRPAQALRLWAATREAPGALRALVIACALGALAGISGLALTATSVWLICRAAQHPNVQALAVAVVGVRTFALSKAVLRYGERLTAHDGALRLLARVRAQVFAALEPLAPSGLGRYRRGDLLRRFTSDVDAAQEALIRAVVPLAGAAASALAAIALAALIDPLSGFILAAGVGLAAVVVPGATRRAGAAAEPAAVAGGRREALVNGLLDGLEELTVYDGTRRRLAQIRHSEDLARAATRPAGRAGAIGAAAAGMLAAVTVPALVAAGAAGATPMLLGVLGASALVAFDSVSTLPAAFAALGRCRAALGRVNEVISADVPVPDPAVGATPPAVVSGLALRDATLAPAPGAPPVLAGASMQIRTGQRVALLGPSGSGKSSALTAVLRLLPLTEGELTISGDGREVALADLRASDVPPLVAGSLQGDHVFATTLRDNLRLVAPAATDGDLDAVAERVGLGGWIRALPESWSTQAGADGCNLSGGQRQRLLVARALLADPQVLVLDEPTAHLDAAAEALVMADVVAATQGRTLLLSTHHAELLGDFDQRLHLDRLGLHPDRRRPAPTPAAALR